MDSTQLAAYVKAHFAAETYLYTRADVTRLAAQLTAVLTVDPAPGLDVTT